MTEKEKMFLFDPELGVAPAVDPDHIQRLREILRKKGEEARLEIFETDSGQQIAVVRDKRLTERKNRI